jgi:hypothetical protein
MCKKKGGGSIEVYNDMEIEGGEFGSRMRGEW